MKKDGSECHVVVTAKRCVAAASNDTAPVLMTLDARLKLLSPTGVRWLSLDEFYVNDGTKNMRLDMTKSLSCPYTKASTDPQDGVPETPCP